MSNPGLDGMHLMLTFPTQWETGRYSSVSMKPFGGATVIVSVHDVVFSRYLHYSVGIVNQHTGETEWGEVISYDTGRHPSVSLMHKDGELYVIETHCNHFKSCYYLIGIVHILRKRITWKPSRFLCHGLKPKVSTKDDGTVMIVKEKSYSWSNIIQYHIGRLDTQDQQVVWNDKEAVITDFHGVEPDITVNRSNIVVMCRSTNRTTGLQFKKGTLYDDLAVTWNNTSVFRSNGKNPSISLNSDGNIVEVHQKPITRQLSYCCGRIMDNSILWGKIKTQGNGEYPTVSLSDDGYVYETHKTNFGIHLFHIQGELKSLRPKSATHDSSLSVPFQVQDEQHGDTEIVYTAGSSSSSLRNNT